MRRARRRSLGRLIMKRFLLIALLVLVLLIGGGFLYLRYYLRSPAVTHQVATRLEAIYGAPVRVESVDVGMSGSTLAGFELFEPGTDASQGTPWLKVGSLTTDISLWDILRGQAMPKNVTLTGATVVLRFDAEGQLATQFPAQAEGETGTGLPLELPAVVLEQGQVVLRKAGQPELIVRDVSAQLTRKERGQFSLSGTAENADLGKLLLSGSYDAGSREAVATLKTAAAAHVTGAFLERLPYVPPATWQEVPIEVGDTPAELTMRYNLAGGPIHWRLTMVPERTRLRVAVLDLAAEDAHGKLILEDGLLELRQVHGKAYGGEIGLDADLDFRDPETRLSFPKITLTNLKVSDVPESWNEAELRTLRKLAPEGKLTGTASVQVTIQPARLSPEGVESIVGLTASHEAGGRWLPAVAALAAFPHRQIDTRSTGKATVAPVAGGAAEIELKLGPHTKRAPSPEINITPSVPSK
jgi:hypothetical protein